MAFVDFTNQATWHGGHYELALRYRGLPPETLEKALSCVWSQPGMDGGYPSRNVDVAAQARQQVIECTTDLDAPLYGLAQMSDGKLIPCGTLVVREDYGPSWIVFYLPMGGLARAYPEAGSFPFGLGGPEDAASHWRQGIDSWMKALGRAVYRCAPFDLGLVGFEASMEATQTAAADQLPPERWIGYLIPNEQRLVWYPPTVLAAPIT